MIEELPGSRGIAMAGRLYRRSRSVGASRTLRHVLRLGSATHRDRICLGVVEFALVFMRGIVGGRFLGRRKFQSTRKLARIGLDLIYKGSLP
jgi:hypothetical protein